MKGELRATFRNNVQNSKNVYRNSSSILLISVGQEYHEGEKLCSTIDLLQQTKFSKCTLVLGDTIQRYDYCLGTQYTPEEKKETALSAGNAWLERNRLYLNKMQGELQISRWSDWLTHPMFNHFQDEVRNAYMTVPEVKEKFNYSADKFLNRYRTNRCIESYSQRDFDYCIDYLIEECAIIMPLFASENFDYVIYPNKMLLAMEATYQHCVEKKYPGKLHWLSLRFKRKVSVGTEDLSVLET